MSEPIGNTKQLAEPVAVRYDFDGYGYMYMDAGSGSDWASRVKNCEFLYTHPMRDLTDEDIVETLDEIVGNIQQFYEDDYHKLKAEYDLLKAHLMRELSDEEIYAEMIKCIDSTEDGHTFKYKNFARAIIKAMKGEK